MKRQLAALAAAAVLPLAAAAQGTESAGRAEHHGAAPASVIAFHEVLAPDWHADAGPERTKATCNHVSAYYQRAAAVAADNPPDGADLSDWLDATSALALAVETLDATCASETQESFDDDFAAVHARYHDVAALTGDEGGQE